MTEKRYSYFKSPITGLYVICDGKHRETFSGLDDEYNCSRIVRKLNILTDENEQLKRANDIAIDGLTLCQEKNSELELRNNRQASTIDNLYSLIEKEDWTALKKIIEEIEEAEELNRLEFEAYCGENDD